MKQKFFNLKCAECNKVFQSSNEKDRLCPECKKIRESRKKPKRKVNTNKNKSILQIIKEIEKYNKEHKIRLSYGQYVALVDK